MGAGQIGGIATLLDMDFNNAAGFLGKPSNNLDGQYVVYYLSHAMLFCAGALIEPHVALTPAVCVYGEEFKFAVYGGSHKFLLNAGASRMVENICIHRAYNHTGRCGNDNIALMVMNKQFSFWSRDTNTDYIMNRVRYGVGLDSMVEDNAEVKCRYFGWGSRRNGFLLPLLIEMRRMDAKVLDSSKCDEMWNTDNKFLCLNKPPCTNEKFGALCPDDLGTVLVCNGYVQGMMTSSLIDRPCGVGFLNIIPYIKFLECAVDDARDTIHGDDTLDLGDASTPPTMKRVDVFDDINMQEKKSTTECPENAVCAPKVTLGRVTTVDKIEIIENLLKPTTTPPGDYRIGKRNKHRF